MSKAYLVWNEGKTECVGFTDKSDAQQAAGIRKMGNPCSALTDAWRELYADDEPKLKFDMQEIEIVGPGY
jgi:hypothetical protein